MDAVFKTAKAAGHILVDFYNDFLGSFADGHHMGSIGAKVKIAVLVRGKLEHGNIVRGNGFPVVAWQFRITDGGIVGTAPGN